MKEVKMATFEKREGEALDKFVDALNNADEAKKPVRLVFSAFRDGVLFGSDCEVTYLKNNTITGASRDGNRFLANLFEQAYADLKTYEEATIERGSTPCFKKALRLTGKSKQAFVNEKIIRDIPKGSRFLIKKHNLPVLVMYEDTIIKIVLPFVNYGGDVKFEVAEK